MQSTPQNISTSDVIRVTDQLLDVALGADNPADVIAFMYARAMTELRSIESCAARFSHRMRGCMANSLTGNLAAKY